MSFEWLQEIERRAEAATQGPWRVGDAYIFGTVNDGSAPEWKVPPHIPLGECCLCGRNDLIATIKGSRGETLHVHPCEEGAEDWHVIISDKTFETIAGNYDYEAGGICSKPEDSTFIARARSDVPRLCRAVRELANVLRPMLLMAEEWVREYGELKDREQLEEAKTALERWERGGDRSD